ncbi:hypothetical protein [Ornithinibacillus contaminans]|uniref:hypothetical protein n=1 Tax=Ornithinibacillus contaminans TaxID=694055 RepID=UPI00064DA8D3|nr:hypothetical protein [Ornithinibacillus contaminans]
MEIKNVYAIRVNKKDKDLRDYLSQFPQDEQANALRELINYGISSLNNNFQAQQSIQELQEGISKLKQEQDAKLDKIINLLNNNSFVAKNEDELVETENKENVQVDVNKAKNNMQEALSMFMNG